MNDEITDKITLVVETLRKDTPTERYHRVACLTSDQGIAVSIILLLEILDQLDAINRPKP